MLIQLRHRLKGIFLHVKCLIPQFITVTCWKVFRTQHDWPPLSGSVELRGIPLRFCLVREVFVSMCNASPQVSIYRWMSSETILSIPALSAYRKTRAHCAWFFLKKWKHQKSIDFSGDLFLKDVIMRIYLFINNKQQYRSYTLHVENYDITRTILLSLILRDSLTKFGKLRYWKMPFEHAFNNAGIQNNEKKNQ